MLAIQPQGYRYGKLPSLASDINDCNSTTVNLEIEIFNNNSKTEEFSHQNMFC